MDQIDIVMTATVRPDVLELTLHSFFRHFLSQFSRSRLIINIDPIGEPGRKVGDILAVCRQFPAEIVHRCPAESSFADAVRWGWSQVESEFFLHLEDDWLLKRFVSWKNIEALMAEDSSVASVRLNLSRNPGSAPLRSGGMSLNPSIVRRRFITEALPYFNVGLDPEKQLRTMRGPAGPVLDHWKYLYYGLPCEPSYVIDIGKKWRRSFRLKKEVGVERPTIWAPEFIHSGPTVGFLRMKYRLFLCFWRILAGCHSSRRLGTGLVFSHPR